jgi:hyperpolarization activated cyclic nucleotide-gated potassium channel 1
MTYLNARRQNRKSTVRTAQEINIIGSLNQTINNPYNQIEGLLEETPYYIFHPEGRKRVIWNLFVACLLLYTAIVMPFVLAFYESNDMDEWGIIDIMLDVFFFIDLILNCFTGIYDSEGKLIVDLKVIIWTYAKGWMLWDLAACFPFGLINGDQSDSYSSNDYNNLIRLLRLPRLYRLFRITRLFKMFKHYKNNEIIEKIQEFLSMKHSIMRLITTSITILLCVHIFSCFWVYISKIEGNNPDTWISVNGFNDKDVMFLYITSVYWAITTLCTVGYGDIHPYSNLEKLFSIGWMLFGVYFLSFVIGSLSSMLNSIDTKENILVNKLAIIDEFSKEANLSKTLTSRLRHALRYSTEKTGFSWSDKQNIFNELPKNLRYEVSMAMHKGAAKSLFFFIKRDQVVIASIIPFLQPIFIQGTENIYKTGEYAEEIYFIVKGKVAYTYGKENIELWLVNKGEYFGDIEVSMETLRKTSAKAVRNCELLIMNKQLISDIIEEYPRVWDEIKHKAFEHERKTAKAIAENEAYNELKNNNTLDKFDVGEIKRIVEKKLRNKQYQQACKQRLMKFYNANNSVEDIYDKLDSVCTLFAELDTEMSKVTKFLKKKQVSTSKLKIET